MLSWNKMPDSSPAQMDEIDQLPNGTYAVRSLCIVADERAVHLVLSIRTAGQPGPRMLGIELAKRKGAEAADQSADLCREALLRKFGAETTDEVVKYFIEHHGPNWALKYIPLDDHILEFYEEARFIIGVLASDRGGDTW